MGGICCEDDGILVLMALRSKPMLEAKKYLDPSGLATASVSSIQLVALHL